MGKEGLDPCGSELKNDYGPQKLVLGVKFINFRSFFLITE